jgi:hypothetical protein
MSPNITTGIFLLSSNIKPQFQSLQVLRSRQITTVNYYLEFNPLKFPRTYPARGRIPYSACLATNSALAWPKYCLLQSAPLFAKDKKKRVILILEKRIAYHKKPAAPTSMSIAARRSLIPRLWGTLTKMSDNPSKATSGDKMWPTLEKLTGRAFYESIGSPKMVIAPMVDRSEFVGSCSLISGRIIVTCSAGVEEAHSIFFGTR